MQGVDNMKTAKVKMEQVREENERLKLTLSQMMNDYHSLKKQFNDKIKEDDHQLIKITTDLSPMAALDHDDESELVSLSLGRFSHDSNNTKLGLGLDFRKSKSTEAVSMNLFDEESKEEVKNNVVVSSRGSPKKSRSTGDDEDDVLQSCTVLKKPRVSVRAVCNTQTVSILFFCLNYVALVINS